MYSGFARKSSPKRLRFSSLGAIGLLAALFLLAVTPAAAQGVRGTIAGKVADESGGILPGATVQLISPARNQVVRTVVTDDQGAYQFLEIEPEVYQLLVQLSNFSDTRTENVKVEPNRNLRLDVTLRVAGGTDTVTVTATEELVDRETATLGTTVENRRVEGLPLDGRNVLNLALLQPGVVPANQLAAQTFGGGLGIRVNGQRGVENNITLDGSNNNEVAVGGAASVLPRPDAIQEFRLLTSNFEAEFGRNTGSVINVVTKGGTSEYHGNARFFWRPTTLSAARYFDNALGEPDQDQRRRFERKEFGGNIGGPVKIPGLYDGSEKTFFFVDYEGRRQLIGATQTVTGLPSQAERSGDFSGLGVQLLDPATGQPFPGNQIPAERISPIAQFYLPFLPGPDASGQAVASADQITDTDQVTARFDHFLNDRHTLSYSFNLFDFTDDDPFPFGGGQVPGFGSLDLWTSQNHVVRHTWAVSPSFVNSLLVGYTRNDQPSVAPQNTTTPQEIGFSGNFVANSTFAGPPFIRLFDRGLSFGNSIQGPQARVTENFQLQDSVSWGRGDHRFKFGFDGTHYRQDQTFLFINQGLFTYSGFFGGNTTGDDFADFLIGNSPIAVQVGANGLRDYRQNAAAWFFQDTWRLSDELTLSLGMRWEYTSPITDKFDRVAYYRPGAISEILTSGQLRDFDTGAPVVVPPGGRAPSGLVYVGDPDPLLGGSVPRGGVNKDWNNFAPRIGIAWSPSASDGVLGTLFGNNKTVVRTGFGVFYGSIIGDTALQQLSAPGFNGTNAFFFPGSGTLSDPFAPDPFPNYMGDFGQLPNPFEADQFTLSAPLSLFSQPIDPFIRTPYTYQYNLTVQRGFLNDYVFSASYVGNRSLKQFAREQINPSVGTFIPVPDGRVIPTPTATNTNSRRLNGDILTGLNQLVAAGNSWYNGLQLQMQKRFGQGLLYQVSYTFSKSITEVDTQRGTLDLLSRSFGRSLSSDDIPHRFVASWIWELPWGRNLQGPAGAFGKGWGFGGIATFQSGTPISVTNPFDTVGTGGGILSFADMGPEPFTTLDPRENNNAAFNSGAFQIFGNPATGFDLARDFRRGTSGPNQFRVDNGVNNFDLIVTKKTQLWNEDSNLELRFEMFNALNHAQFLDVDTNLVNDTFGNFTSTRESRVIQLGARINF